MTLPADPVITAAEKLLGCLTDLLDSEAPVCRSSLVPGQVVVMDECCDCESGMSEGQASVRVDSVYPTLSFPTPLTQGNRVAAGVGVETYAVVLEMGVFRCAATMTEDGSPPSAAELTADAVAALRDAQIMRRAARCCFGLDPGGDEDELVLVGAWRPVGPAGGCHGGIVTVTTLVYDCGC